MDAFASHQPCQSVSNQVHITSRNPQGLDIDMRAAYLSAFPGLVYLNERHAPQHLMRMQKAWWAEHEVKESREACLFRIALYCIKYIALYCNALHYIVLPCMFVPRSQSFYSAWQPQVCFWGSLAWHPFLGCPLPSLPRIFISHINIWNLTGEFDKKVLLVVFYY